MTKIKISIKPFRRVSQIDSRFWGSCFTFKSFFFIRGNAWKGICISLYLMLCGPLLGQERFIEIGASPNPVGSGARAMGLGNAFIAVADDATAASWNPAGLKQLKKPEFSFAIENISRREDVQIRAIQNTASTESADFTDFNYASFVFPYFYKRNMVFSLSYFKLFSFDKEFTLAFDSAIIGSNTAFEIDIDQEGEFSVVAPAFGIEVTKRLALGTTLYLWNDSLTQTSAYEFTTTSTQTSTDPFGNLIQNTLETKDVFEVDKGHSLVFGSLYRVNKKWSIAAVVKPSFRLDIDIHNSFVNTRVGAFQTDIDRDQSESNAEIRFPLTIGVGVAYRPNDPFTLSLDVTWTQWSHFTFDGEDETTITLGGTNLKNIQFDDTFAVRMGGEYLMVSKKFIFPLRFGLGYDPAPAVRGIDDFYTINFGTGIQLFNRVNFDVAYEFRWGNNVNEFSFLGIEGRQDIQQHRILASMIYYF